MPLAPFYQITEDDDGGIVVVHIRTPHVSLNTAELDCEGCRFNFRNGCYRLELYFPFDIDTEDDLRYVARARKARDSEKYPVLEARLPKAKVGPTSNVDLLCIGLKGSKMKELVSNEPSNTDKTPLIQEVTHSDVKTDSKEGESEESDSDTSSTTTSTEDGEVDVKYGFMNKYSGILSEAYIEEHPDVFEYVGSLGSMDSLQRRVNRISVEDEKFDHLRFMGDFYGILEDDIYTEAVSYQPVWIEEWNAWRDSAGTSEVGSVLLFGNARRVVESETALDSEDWRVFYTIIDILFAYCFDVRCTAGEVSVESATNMTRLSCTLSWLEDYSQINDNMDTVIINCCRRGVCYPYLRNWSLIRMVLDDVGKVLCVGRRGILRSLVNMSKTFSKSDNHSILNTLYISDMIAWMEGLDEHEQVLARVAYEFQRTLAKYDAEGDGKDAIGFPLAELEAAVQRSITRGDDCAPLFLSIDEERAAHEPSLPLQVVQLKLNEVVKNIV